MYIYIYIYIYACPFPSQARAYESFGVGQHRRVTDGYAGSVRQAMRVSHVRICSCAEGSQEFSLSAPQPNIRQLSGLTVSHACICMLYAYTYGCVVTQRYRYRQL